MIGKVPPDVLAERVLGRTGAADPAVSTGPAYGEDAAAIDLDGRTLVVSTDPISLAIDRVGTLGVHVACNDVAASGADPRWLTVAIFLPSDDEALLERVTAQLDGSAEDLGVTIVGGHTEYAPRLERPTLSLTALGLADRFVPTAGAEPGDRVLLTKGAGIEATAIIATDFADRLGDAPAAVLESAAGFYDELSVLDEARLLRDRASAMHDPTEGGLLAGLVELAVASGVTVEVDSADVPVRPETRDLCRAVGVDPLRVFGSGALIAAVPRAEVGAALADLEAAGIVAAEVGAVTAAGPAGVVLDGERVEAPVRDELYGLWAD